MASGEWAAEGGPENQCRPNGLNANIAGSAIEDLKEGHVLQVLQQTAADMCSGRPITVEWTICCFPQFPNLQA